MTIYSLINTVRALGIKLWQEDGQLKIKAPKGALTDDIREQISSRKSDIIAFLSQVSATKKLPPPLRPVDRAELDRQPLSFLQERLWIIDRLNPENTGYNIPAAFVIKGKLDIALLNKALNVLIARHESLRTVFPDHKGQARQVVLDSLKLEVESIDLSRTKAKKIKLAEAKKICEADATAPFDLATGPLIRAKVIKLAPQEHILMLNIHHIVSDDWSANVMFKELFLTMDALQDGKEFDLPALPVQYLDYSVWQRQWFEEGGELKRQLAYWQQKLAGAPESLGLATDYPRPAVQSFEGASQSFTIDPQLTTLLRSLAEQQGCTLYMMLLAIFKVLLYRYTGQDDICIGTAISNRQAQETRGLIGMFVNTLALRTQVKSEDTFLEALSKVKTTCVEAYAHQDTPFEKIVDAVQVRRDPSVNPLFQVMVTQNIPLSLPKEDIQPFHLDRHSSKFDMAVEFTENDNELTGVIEYCTSLFRRGTIERLINNFIALCASASANPNAKITELNYLSGEERQQLLIDFNNTEAPYPKDKCIHHLFAEQAKQNPDEIAVIFEDEQLTYKQLYDKSHVLALYLQSVGVKQESLVGVCVDRSVDMIVALMGILQAGGAYVPLDPNYPEDRIAFMLRDSQASVVLTQEKLKKKLRKIVPHEAELIALDQQWKEITASVSKSIDQKVKLSQKVTPDNLAYVIYTSGSTGKPKGVAIEHHSTVALLNWAKGVFGRDQLAGVLASTSICFDLSVYEIFLPLSVGGKVILAPDALALTNFAHRASVTLINTVPSVMGELVRIKNAIPDTVTTINLAGEPLSSALVDKIYDNSNVEKVYDLYGPSEDTTYSTFTLREKNGPQTIGRPISNTQAYILDRFNNPLPVGIPGELHLAGAGLARCYLNRPELTREKFVPSPFNPGTPMYKTGDLARWLENGTIEYLGRIDRQVKIRGFRIEIGEIEHYLDQHPKVIESAVVAQGEGVNKKLIAFYVASETRVGEVAKVSNEDLNKHLSQFLSDYMLPATFVSVESIPLTQNGKVDRRVLEAIEVDAETTRDHHEHVDDIENQLIEIWAEILDRKPEAIGIRQKFFDIGGNSINAITLAAHIEEKTQCKFSPIDLFKYGTIRGISQYIKENTIIRPESSVSEELSTTLSSQKRIKTKPDTEYPEYYDDSLAIVGISCHFPDAEDHWQFWKNLVERKESINLLSKEEAARLNVAPEILNDPGYVPLKPWMEGKEFFDPEFFQISSGNAALMDPQFRQLLQHSWRAVEDAGYRCEEIENTSVFMSASNNFYQSLAEKIQAEGHVMEDSSEFVSWVLAQGGTIPTMISYQLGLRGPSAFVHSNCSSSMTGLYYAFQSLQSKDVDYALVGAATLSASLGLGYLQMPGMNFSSDGHCRAFDAKADGMVDGEGVGVILVKRAADAIKDGDHIYSLIRGISVNNDGSDKVGFYAPGVSGQTAVIRNTLEKTGINPESISYVEAHGTGTALGDPIEVRSISEAYEKYTNKKQFCAIGSVKPNIGHLDTAAGLAGTIKLAMSLYHKKFPSIINYTSPNPQIDFENSPFYVSDQEESWAEAQYPKRAAISSFGIGGTNAHAILEEYSRSEASFTSPDALFVVPLSAQKEDILKEYAQKLLLFLESREQSQINLSEIAYTLQTGRKEMAHRVVFVVKDLSELLNELQAFIENKKSDGYFRGDVSTGKKPVESLEDDEDYQELIRHWFVKKKVRRLAQLWASGTSLDWKLLYDQKFPLRMSLPAYPFAKVRCWIDTTSSKSLATSRGSSGAMLHPLLHTNTSDFSSQSYGSVFSGKEFFLADHRINGQKVLPAVAYLEMACAAVMKATSGQFEPSMLELGNIVWVKPIIVNNETQTHINLSVSDQGQIAYEIGSTDGMQQVVHCEGNAEFTDRPVPEMLDIARLREQMDHTSMDAAQVYAMFDKTDASYGPAHQSLENVWIGEEQVLAQLTLPAVVRNTLDEYVMHPSLMDGALQASNILFDYLNQNVAQDVLPFALRSLRIGSRCTEEVFVWVRLAKDSKPEDRLIKLDIDLCDPEGNSCVQMHGFSFRMISKGQRGLQDTDNRMSMHLAAPVWQPQPVIPSREGNNTRLEQHHVILCEVPGIEIKQIGNLLPGRQCQQIEQKAGNIAERFEEAALQCFEKIQTILKSKLKRKVLVQLVFTNEPEQTVFAGLSGLLRTASMENPNFIGQVILIDRQTTAEQLAQLALDNCEATEESLVKYAGGKRHVLQWEAVEPTQALPKIPFNDKGVYLITGGLGGLGVLFTREILKQTKNGRIILTGRSELTGEKKKILDTLTRNTTVEYRQVDIGDQEQVNGLIADIINKHKQLNGIFHSAGIISDSFILKKTTTEFGEVLAPKVRGTLNLDHACSDVDLDFMVLFSSDSAFGSVGQADYAAANGFMDHFASYRNLQVSEGHRQGRTLSINWPLWQDGGMKLDQTILEMQQQTTGMRPMPTATGILAFYQCLESGYDQLSVTVKDLYQQQDESVSDSISDRPVQTPVEQAETVSEESFVAHNQSIKVDGGNLFELTQEFLKKQFSELFKLPAHQIDPQASLENYGIDSILTINITNQLEKTFGALSKTLLFEYHTIQELTEYFLEEFEEKLTSLFAGSSEKNPKKTVEQKPEQNPEPKAVVEAKAAQPDARRFYHRGLANISTNSNNRTRKADQKEELIAIVGLSGRYPESLNIEEYWNNLRNGKDCIVEIPEDRWDWKEYFSDDKTKDGVHYSKYGGFIAGVDEFDPRFFNISPKEAEILDPQERLFLQHAWMAIEDAGYTRASLQIPHGRNLPGQVGVYVGVMYSEYQLFGAEISQQGKRMGFANSMADVSNRVSFVLNVHGPSFTVDTMCSSSLTTIHLACQDLKSGRTDMAIAGGVNVSVHPNKYLLLSSGQYISTTGHCHSFGVGGDGYIPGEGVGAVVLKRLSDAEKSGDHIYGLIRGSGLNHGGKPSGYTVPNPQAQSALISQVLEESNTDPRHISYVEAHGTGTPLGDPIEINALTKAFNQKHQGSSSESDDRGICLIGSVKSNIGHCESAAGVAGLTKILLQMKHQQIVPSLHSRELNPNIDFAKTPFVVNQKLTDWEQPVLDGKKLPRIAGISSFGAGGSNAHIILEEYAPEVEPVEENKTVVVPLSARTPEQLKQKVHDLIHFIRHEQKPVNLVSLAYTLQVGREAMEERLGFIVNAVDQLLELLEAYAKAQQSGGKSHIDGVYQGQVKRNKETMLIFSHDDDMKETIDKWITRNKLEKLLDLWVKGLDLDWLKLYGDARPKRMSLPTYPFARERYWWNDAVEDGKLTLKQWINKQNAAKVIHPMLHVNTSNLGQQSYSTTFTGEEVYLKEYGGSEQKVLPATAYLEMARAAIEHALPQKSESGTVVLRDVVLAQPVMVGKNRQVSLSLFPQDSKHIDFEVHSDDAGEDIVHCQGHAVITEQPAVTNLDIAQIEVQTGPGQLLTEVSVPGAGSHNLNGYMLHPGILNSALEAAHHLVPGSAGAIPFPHGVESVHILSPYKEKMLAWVRYAEIMQPADADIKLDIDLCDEQGHISVQIRGLSYLQASMASPEPVSQQVQSSSGFMPQEIAIIPMAHEEAEGNSTGDRQHISVQSPLKKPTGIILPALDTVSVAENTAPSGKIRFKLPDAGESMSLQGSSFIQPDLVSLFEYGEGVFLIQLGSAELSKDLTLQILQALKTVKQIETVKVLFIRSGESDFLLGGRQHYNDAVEQKLYEAISGFPYPVIAVMQGNAGGAGFLLGALCDFMVCNEDATYFYTDPKGGLFPAVAEDRLLKERFGVAYAYDLMYLSTKATGRELKEKGWNFPVMPKDQIEQYVQRLALNLARKPQKSLRLIKQHLARHIGNVVNELAVVNAVISTDKAPASAHVKDSIPSFENITVTTHSSHILGVRISPVAKGYSIADCIADLTDIFKWVKQSSHHRSVVLESDNAEFFEGAGKQFTAEVVANFSDLILKLEIPVIAILDTDSKGLWWLLGQFCDGCVYSKAAHYSAIDIIPNAKLASIAAMIFAYRFGDSAGKEILLSGADYTGLDLKQRTRTLAVADKDQALATALKIASSWAEWSASVLAGWKQYNATSIREKMSNLLVSNDSEREFNPVAEMSPVSLQSEVISATADPEGILVVSMEDREAKNMFTDALTQGIIEVFEHVKQTPAYKAVVLTGFDNYFASGGTKEDLVAIQQGKARFTDIKFYHLAMECHVPVIAAMQGHAIGAGWAFGMFADFTFFSEESKYLSPYMNFGFTPGAGATFILPGKIGNDLARETLLVAQEISGSELKDRGLQAPVMSRKQVVPAALALARQIAKNSIDRIVAIKKQLTAHQHDAVEETYQLELAMHDETFVGQSETLEQIRKYFGQDNDEALQTGHSVAAAVANNVQPPAPKAGMQSAGREGTISELAADLKNYLAQELHMQEDEIDEEAEFIDLGLDSITGVTWVRKINEKYNLSVEATKIYSYPTLISFVEFIKDELSKQGVSLDEAPADDSEPTPDQPGNTNGQAMALSTSELRAVPTPSNGTGALLSVGEELRKLLAEELHMQEDEIDDDAEFIDLGLDSITGVTWVRKINEKYKITIEATKVYSYPTLTDFSKFVKGEAEKHGAIVNEQVPVAKKSASVDAPVYTPKTTPNQMKKMASAPPVLKKLTSWRKQSHLRINPGSSATAQVQPIAIIGMAGQFPQAKNVEEFWDNIVQGRNCISKVQRWDLATHYREGEPVPGKTNCEWMGSLEDHDLFDPLFFNIAPTEAETMDPQQRLFLQSCWHSIENAGYDARTLSGSKCGVFVGAGAGDYQFLSRELQVSAKGFTGTANSILAARISYFLNLQGPCLTIDTACSSSLVAIATACDSLISGNSDLALAGGVCVMATPDLHIKSSQSGMLSKDGRCYTFDDRANGFVPGEGVGVVMLKRLSDAERDQDRIIGVLEGWGVNQDGKTNGITAPSPESQKRLMQDVYDKFNIDPASIQLIEAHGTGTKLGDPIEVAALVESFSKYTREKEYCAIGSVKSNIGHCMAAAGVAGVIKASLALKNKQLPPTINFTRLNEHINLKDTPFYVNDRLQTWNGSAKHHAAVSSFGFSGTNAHLVISGYEPRKEPKPVDIKNPEVIIPLSARNTERLMHKAGDLLDHIRKYPSVDLHEMAYTLQTGREAMDDRLGFVVNSIGQLTEKLQAYVDGEKSVSGVFYGQVNRNKDGMQFLNQDQEVQETLIDKWISNNQLAKLLGAWVKGLSFDWNRLYGAVKPQRIDLPLYPFARERYWVEPEVRHMQVSNAEASVIIHPLVHTNTSNFSQQCYSSVFSGEEFFLRDHQVQINDDGAAPQSVLPGVAYLEMARAAIENAMSFTAQSGTLELQNIIWVRPVIVTGQVQLSIALSANDDTHIDFEIYRQDNGHTIVYCQGQAVLKGLDTPARMDTGRLTQEMQNGQLDAYHTYKILRKLGLYYGPAHQGIKILHRGKEQVLAQLQLPEVLERDHVADKFVLHPSLMDSAIQAAVGFTEDLDQPSGQPSLPFAMDKLQVFSPCTTAMYSWVRYAPGNKRDSKLSKLDIDLIDQNGNVCVQMRGFTSRVLEGETPQPFHDTQHLISSHTNGNGNGNGSSFNEGYYETLMEKILNNEISIDEAVDSE
ncbi:Long-chain-fatty-acid--CoA ligase [Fulvivirga imtechensis AK7]|uniref:Long-chain-fatty-acid--CoA ligase n=1 Tax=Fulvivirga imtechensis AK7 TaxID=1237149 RepID=L8JT98_9BACT|nr:non-ribosomal peptide synthetase [Fulvivirga imtechensis]ELR72060.1 Long-chain-fatty-acid--CoA ligase [Fulvivirga imtechensis AK7]